MFTSFNLESDGTIRLGDRVCTEGTFDLEEEKYRAVLKKSTTVGLRALRDRRLVAIRQSAMMASRNRSSGGGGGGGGLGGATAAAAAADLFPPESVPVSPNILMFQSGPSTGSFQKRQPSRVPSKNREELERIQKLLRLDEQDDEDDDDDDSKLDDDAALLRRSMAEAKKKQKAAAAAALAAQELGSANSTWFHKHEQTETEREAIKLIDDSIPYFLGTAGARVRLFGTVTGIDAKSGIATIQVWRKGETVYTERRPLEKISLTKLMKISNEQFFLVCNQPLIQNADAKTRKIQTGAVSIEDMPATLMSHTNEIVESLIKKMETTANIQQQAVNEELAALRDQQQQPSSSPSSPGRGRKGGDFNSASSPSSGFASLSASASFSSQQRQKQQLQQQEQQQQDQEENNADSSSEKHHHQHHHSSPAASVSSTSLSAGGGGHAQLKDALDFSRYHLRSVGGNNNNNNKISSAPKPNQRLKLRGTSLKNRATAFSRQTLQPDSPLLERYYNGTKCGVSVIRNLPEPPVTRLIDPLVDVREEFKALSVMNTPVTGGGGGGGISSFKPQSEYIRSLQRAAAASSPGGVGAAGGGKKGDTSSSSSSSSSHLRPGSASVPVLGTKRVDASANSSSASLSVGADSGIKIPQPNPSFIEDSLREIRTPPPSFFQQQQLQNQITRDRTSSLGLGGGGSGSGVFSSSSPSGSGDTHLLSSSSSSSPASGNTKSSKKSERRRAQPLPPTLLYSSYPADAEILPPEIPCTVLEYRRDTKTLLMNVRSLNLNRPGTAGSVATSNSSPNSTARGAAGGGGGNKKNLRPSSATSSTGSNSNAKGELSEAAQHQQTKWQNALDGLSTILVQCAFVDIISHQLSDDDNNNNDNDLLLLSGEQQQQSNSNQQRPGSSSSHSHSQHHREDRNTLFVNDGDSYLAALVGKRDIEIIPLWSECIDGEYAVICDIQRGDLSILDEMVSSGYASVSSRAIGEYNDIKGQFASASPQTQQMMRGLSFFMTSNSSAAGTSNNSGSVSPNLSANASSPPSQNPSRPHSANPNNENNNINSSSSSSATTSARPGSAGGGGGGAGVTSATTISPSASGTGTRPTPITFANDEGEASFNTKQVHRLKSGYFSAQAAHQLVEQDPDLVLNAAESFLGRRVFRLLEASKMQQQMSAALKLQSSSSSSSSSSQQQQQEKLLKSPTSPSTSPPSSASKGFGGNNNSDSKPAAVSLQGRLSVVDDETFLGEMQRSESSFLEESGNTNKPSGYNKNNNNSNASVVEDEEGVEEKKKNQQEEGEEDPSSWG